MVAERRSSTAEEQTGHSFNEFIPLTCFRLQSGPVDMFPVTTAAGRHVFTFHRWCADIETSVFGHVETVVLMSRRDT